MEYRIERDTMGEMPVPSSAYYGCQTARAIVNFQVGGEQMPAELLRAMAILKRAAALANHELGALSGDLCEVIARAAAEVAEGRFDGEFPLVVWQSGSGTQTNMNVNEVIANRANEMLGSPLGAKKPVHPNDHVNMSQSTNDVFPAAIHVAAAEMVRTSLVPALQRLREVLASKAEAFRQIVKIGRTHLMDAVPLTLGQEFAAYARQLENGIARIEQAMPGLLELPIGGTAVGTGLNTPKDYDVTVVRHINAQTECEYGASPCKFEGLAAHDACVMMSGALKTLACSLMKIANDLRWMASGPRCGLGELSLPDNEPGSSIMPGKVNPTQCEMVTMVCCQVMGNDTTIAMAGASGNFELNVYKPVIALNLLQSIRLLAGAAESFTTHCVEGAEPVAGRIEELLDRSLMLVTALNKHIGYDAAAKIAQSAHRNGTTLMQEAMATGLVSEEDFRRIVDPRKMV